MLPWLIPAVNIYGKGECVEVDWIVPVQFVNNDQTMQDGNK